MKAGEVDRVSHVGRALILFYFSFLFFFFKLKIAYNTFSYFVIQFNIKTFGKKKLFNH